MREQRGERRLQRVVSWLCAIVFTVFCFTFTAVYQAPLLEALYDNVSTGKLMYNEYVVASAITTLLLLLALWLNRIAKFQREWTAMAYLPSSLLLAMITDIDSSIYTGGKSLVGWISILAAGLFVYAFMAFLLQRVLFVKIKDINMEGNRCIWRNFLLFTIMFCIVGWLSNSNENMKHEAHSYWHYKRGNVDAALNVAKRSLSASQELTAARAFYLAQKGELGERLFDYPQYYGSDGLLPHIKRNSPLHPDTVYAALGVPRGKDESAMEYLRRAVTVDSVPSKKMLGDYLLCALLLDKRIEEFVYTLPVYYNMAGGEELPRHYKEALLYYAVAQESMELSFDTDSMRTKLLVMGMLNWDYADNLPPHYREGLKSYVLPTNGIKEIVALDSLGPLFDKMLKLEEEHPELHIRSNFIRRFFGDTYWWYFCYSE